MKEKLNFWNLAARAVGGVMAAKAFGGVFGDGFVGSARGVDIQIRRFA